MNDARREIKSPEQVARALAQREANARAARESRPLPYPNLWDELDPTKIPPEETTPERITESYREFCEICRPPRRKIHVL